MNYFKDWRYHNRSISPNLPPHMGVNDTTSIYSGELWRAFPKAIRLSYISDWDCKDETCFWYIIKDTPFDVLSLKAKRRYEITKANKNFTVRRICQLDFVEELYDVYIDSLRGYKQAEPETFDVFRKQIEGMFEYDATIGGGREMFLYGAWDNDKRLCGYAHLIKYEDCMLFSQLKTRPSSESKGINAAICNQILVDREEDLKNGCFYISDGARNLYHTTHFQDYLEKYFQFRKAYCRLNIVYPPRVKPIISLIYPLRNCFKYFSFTRTIWSLLFAQEIANKCRIK